MGKKRFLGVFGALIMTLGLATAGMAQVTVVGTDTYPADVANLQAAVAANATIYLSGTFNFGTDGSVLINVPNVTIQAASGGATIKGGTNPITTFNGSLPSGCKNLTVRDIHFEGWQDDVIFHMGVEAADNHTLIEGNTFTNTRAGDIAPYAMGVHYCTGAGSAVIKNNAFINLSSLAVSTHGLTLPPEDHLLIEGNKIIDCHYMAIAVDVWDRNLVDFDNGPVIISNNEISITPPLLDIYGDAIIIGLYWAEGVSNAVVEGNVFKGYFSDAIACGFYGRNRKIMNNDMSELTTWQAAIWTLGRGDLIADNVLGPVDREFAASLGMPWVASGIVIWSLNPSPGTWPDLLPVADNVATDNDFRLTGLKGWALDAAGNWLSTGCVLMITTPDLGWQPYWPGCAVTNNLVKETGRFPAGTGGPNQQVLEFPTHAHHNRIIGHAANEYAQLEASNPGIGQKIKESGAKFMQMLQAKQAFIKKLMGEEKQH